MKYIRKVEELKLKDIKKYIVWFGYDDRKEILKFNGIDTTDNMSVSESGIMISDYLIYEDGEFKRSPKKNSSWLSLNSHYNVFSSDDLEECKEYVILHSSINKYNL